MRFDILTLFPEMVETVLATSITGRAQRAGFLQVVTHQIRAYSEDKHHRVDDTPYGGGKGMLMRPEPIFACYEAVRAKTPGMRRKTIYLSPQGAVLTQKKAEELAGLEQVILLCGHYEGVDRRVIEEIADEEISIGDYILTGGELPACVLVDCVARLTEGVLADEICYTEESISCGMLEYPQYTRPENFRGRRVPDVLLRGDHKEIQRWRFETALQLTYKNRPDLL